MTNTNLTDLLQRVAGLDTRPPRSEACDAIRTLEEALVEALHGETLRGLPNLGTGRSPMIGANLRGNHDGRVAFPRDGQEMGTPTVILRSNGRLAVAWTARMAGTTAPLFDFVYRAAEDDDLRVEDLPSFLALLPKVLTDHLSRVERTQTSFVELRDLAHRVLDLVPAKKGA